MDTKEFGDDLLASWSLTALVALNGEAVLTDTASTRFSREPSIDTGSMVCDWRQAEWRQPSMVVVRKEKCTEICTRTEKYIS